MWLVSMLPRLALMMAGLLFAVAQDDESHNGLRGLTSTDFSRRLAISAEQQTFTIVGTDAAVGETDPYSEGSTVSANGPWGPTYSLGPTHPWQSLNGGAIAPSWINVYNSFFEGLNTVSWVRIRFTMPEVFSNATLNLKMKNDNQGDVALNGNFVATIRNYGEEMFEVGSEQASWLQAGENVITMTLTDEGGWVGYQYLIELKFDATEGADLIPVRNLLGEGGAQGDPHFKTWQGKHFDFHGVCDLVLLQSKTFESGMGLDVHIRTKIRRDMSYISSAALRIGPDILEVESQGVYYFNGVAGAELPSEFGGFEFLHTQPTDRQHVFEVHLGNRERIKVKTYKDFVSVLFEQAQLEHFGESVGLMGDFGKGHMISRDGKTIIDDANAFGQEWQVLDSEPKLFHTLRFPQHPRVCTMPTPAQVTSQLRRRLSESSVDELAAENACEHWGEGKDDCVFDVLTTGDLEMAVVGAY